jgi:hypothetical protein
LAPTCSNCGTNDFVWANELKTGTGLAGTGTLSLRTRGEIPLGTRICRTCGHADLFLRDLSILRNPASWRQGEFVPIQSKATAKPASPPPAPELHHEHAHSAHAASTASHSASPPETPIAPPSPPPPPDLTPPPPPPPEHHRASSTRAEPELMSSEPATSVPESGMPESSDVERSALAAEPPQVSSNMSNESATPDTSAAARPKTPRKRAAKKST